MKELIKPFLLTLLLGEMVAMFTVGTSHMFVILNYVDSELIFPNAYWQMGLIVLCLTFIATVFTRIFLYILKVL